MGKLSANTVSALANLVQAFVCALVLALAIGGQASARNKLDQPLKTGAKVAFLGVVFVDQSTEGAYNGTRDDQTARVKLVDRVIVERLRKEGFDVLDNGPIQKELDNTVNPATCYGCEVRMARELHADYVVVGEVRKTSNLILNMVLLMTDTKTGELVRARIVSMRGNNDDSWLRALNYIFKTHFFPPKG